MADRVVMRPGSPLAPPRASHVGEVRPAETFTSPPALPRPGGDLQATAAADRTAAIDAAAGELATHFRGLRSGEHSDPPVAEGACPVCGRREPSDVSSQPRRLGRPRRVPETVAARVRQLTVDGMSPVEVAGRLDREGVPTAGGGRWTAASVKWLLERGSVD